LKSFKIIVLSLGLALFGAVGVFAETPSLMMATTTSTDDTGLLNYLAPLFKQDSGVELKWTATGTGKALKLGESCDVDVLLVHDPESEKKFVADGFGTDRKEIMYNDFVLIGPAADPAGIKGKTLVDAFKLIQSKKAVFVSRGDQSGTHKKELALWKAAQVPVPDKEQWYIQAGQGMMQTIAMAAERGAYTLADRGTYISYEAKGKPQLVILLEKDQLLYNQYSVIAVNPQKCPKAKVDLAKKFSDWIAGPKAQQLIKEFKVSGKSLFTPNAK
jgi:tungstate transport system substrate-binding protein